MASIRQWHSGYQVRWRDPAGRQRPKSFKRKSDAKQFANRVEVEKQRGTYVDPQLGKLLFADWAHEWLQTKMNLRASSWTRDESYLRNHVMPTFGNIALARIDKLPGAHRQAPRPSLGAGAGGEGPASRHGQRVLPDPSQHPQRGCRSPANRGAPLPQRHTSPRSPDRTAVRDRPAGRTTCANGRAGEKAHNAGRLLMLPIRGDDRRGFLTPVPSTTTLKCVARNGQRRGGLEVRAALPRAFP